MRRPGQLHLVANEVAQNAGGDHQFFATEATATRQSKIKFNLGYTLQHTYATPEEEKPYNKSQHCSKYTSLVKPLKIQPIYFYTYA